MRSAIAGSAFTQPVTMAEAMLPAPSRPSTGGVALIGPVAYRRAEVGVLGAAGTALSTPIDIHSNCQLGTCRHRTAAGNTRLNSDSAPTLRHIRRVSGRSKPDSHRDQ